jgi:hypothetical protein
VTFDLQAPFVADPGTPYWLVLTGATSDNGSAWWVTANSNGTTQGGSGTSDNPYQFGVGSDLAFFLTDDSTAAAAPEPSTIGFMLLGVGMTTLGLRRRAAARK